MYFADADGFANAYRNPQSDAYGDRDRHPNSDHLSYGHTDAERLPRWLREPHPVSHSDANGHAYRHTNSDHLSYGHPDGERLPRCLREPDSASHSHANGHPYRHPDSAAYAHPDTQSYGYTSAWLSSAVEYLDAAAS